MKIHQLCHSLPFGLSIHPILFDKVFYLLMFQDVNIQHALAIISSMLYMPESMIHECSVAVIKWKEGSGKTNGWQFCITSLSQSTS